MGLARGIAPTRFGSKGQSFMVAQGYIIIWELPELNFRSKIVIDIPFFINRIGNGSLKNREYFLFKFCDYPFQYILYIIIEIRHFRFPINNFQLCYRR
ncbi:MAG: hypothetical protein DRR19_33045 [Candidatus Parabeggiatoa sp. nov. 1]|nr:MAG: hypothetical protein DRR19_33045 [Gammaproteobacteria bacterium]